MIKLNQITNEKGKKNMKDRGVTLIALVITIVVMMIIAGTVISLALGKNNIFDMAAESKTATVENNYKDYLKLAILDIQTDHEVSGKTKLELAELKTAVDNQINTEDTIVEENGEDSNQLIVIFANGNKFMVDKTTYEVVE